MSPYVTDETCSSSDLFCCIMGVASRLLSGKGLKHVLFLFSFLFLGSFLFSCTGAVALGKLQTKA